MRISFPFRGLVAATHAPFGVDGELRLAAIEKICGHLLADGVHTVFINGTTGECASLSVQERMDVARRWFDVTQGTPMKVSVHVGSNCLGDCQLLAKHAEELGAISISCFAPHYFKPRHLESLIEWCAAVAGAASETPFYFYDIPGFTHVQQSMPDFLELAPSRIPNLVGLKFTNPDLMSYQLCLASNRGGFDIAYGCDEWLLAALALGARGAVGSTYNFAAPLYLRIINAFSKGDFEVARKDQLKAVRMIKLMANMGFMGAAKEMMRLRGVDVGSPRLPNSSVSEAHSRDLRRMLEEIEVV